MPVQQEITVTKKAAKTTPKEVVQKANSTTPKSEKSASKNPEKDKKTYAKTDKDSIWRGVLGKLQLNLSEYTYKMWFVKCEIAEIKKDTITIATPNAAAQATLKKFETLIKESLEEITEKKSKLSFIIDPKLEQKKIQDVVPAGTSTETASGKKATNAKKAGAKNKPSEAPLFEVAEKIESAQRKAGLVPEYTFENYIRGDSNDLAYSIALTVAKEPGKDYNPLFLYSGVGLGKTHLVQAIGNYILRTKPDMEVIYTTGEEFGNELIEVIQKGKASKRARTEAFRKKYRKTDLLIIDDIQFIIGKDATQREFFHTFNTLYDKKKQIVLTSDRPPKDFVSLEERLTSRFGSGITADIAHADVELRMAILRTLRDQRKDPLGNDVIDFIAEKVDTNIRELKGAYIQIVAKVKVQKVPATIEMAAEELGQVVPSRRTTANPNTIMNAVCKYFQVNKSDIKGRRRTKQIVVPRQIAMYLLRNMTESPLEVIGELLGGRDHTTVMHGTDKIAGMIQKEPRTRQDVENIRNLIFTM
ncbi:chromosomal replication initiator protein DnaA [candidate division WWE3 bacterium]|nr:chromosomal replication initiator protein DnaA [candidate division WWE3 bacterium]